MAWVLRAGSWVFRHEYGVVPRYSVMNCQRHAEALNLVLGGRTFSATRAQVGPFCV